MQRRKLIFFAGGDPALSTHPAYMAYHLATVAQKAGLESEVRLAGMQCISSKRTVSPTPVTTNA